MSGPITYGVAQDRYLSIIDFGASPNAPGAYNTTVIQQAFNAGYGYIPGGDFAINPDIGLFPPSNLIVWGPGRLVFDRGGASYVGITLDGVDNVQWWVRVKADGQIHVGNDAQTSHALTINGGSNNVVYARITHAVGDAVQEKGDATDCVVYAQDIDTTGRAGVSVTNATRPIIYVRSIMNTAGSAVGIEPNAGQAVTDWQVLNDPGVAQGVIAGCLGGVSATDNAEASVVGAGTVTNIAVTNSTRAYPSGGSFDFLGHDLDMSGCSADGGATNGVRMQNMGTVSLTDVDVTDNDGWGVRIFEDVGNSAEYTLTRVRASGNTQGGLQQFNEAATLIDCEGLI